MLGAEGEVLHGANIGGHADQVCATASGEVWVGYGDQGVFDDGPAADLTASISHISADPSNGARG